MAAVSVIMPCYNAAAYLAESIDCVLGQSFTDFELIVIDDGSSDDSAQILRRYAEADARVRVLTQNNSGVSVARNNGLSQAVGEYVAFLDSDDWWESDFLQLMSDALTDQRFCLAYCGWQNVGLEGGRGEPFVPPEYERENKMETLFAGCRWPIHAVLFRRERAAGIGGFDPRLKNAEDYLFWLKLASKGEIVRVPKVLAYYRHHGDGQASQDRAAEALQFWQAQKIYLDDTPDFAARLGAERLAQCWHGVLLKKGYDAYWRRDFKTARTVFRKILALRAFAGRDLKYLLPALLPLGMHKRLVAMLDSGASQGGG